MMHERFSAPPAPDLPPETAPTAEIDALTPEWVIAEQVTLVATVLAAAHAVAPDDHRVAGFTGQWLFPASGTPDRPLHEFLDGILAEDRLRQNIYRTVATTQTRWQQHVDEQCRHSDDPTQTRALDYLAQLATRPRPTETIFRELDIQTASSNGTIRAALQQELQSLPSDIRQYIDANYSPPTTRGKISAVGKAWLIGRGFDALTAFTMVPMIGLAEFLEHHGAPHHAQYVLGVAGLVVAGDIHAAVRKHRALRHARVSTDTITTAVYNFFPRMSIPRTLVAQWLLMRVAYAGTIAVGTAKATHADPLAMLMAKGVIDVGLSGAHSAVNYGITRAPSRDELIDWLTSTFAPHN